MLCSDVMRMEVEALPPDATAEDAARKMREELVGFLVVCGPNARVLGVLTDRDVALRVCAAGLPSTTPVSELMTREIVSCRPEDPLTRAEDQMIARQKSRVVVMDEEGRLHGVISLTDVAHFEEPLRAARVLREITAREFRSVPRSRRSLLPAPL